MKVAFWDSNYSEQELFGIENYFLTHDNEPTNFPSILAIHN